MGHPTKISIKLYDNNFVRNLSDPGFKWISIHIHSTADFVIHDTSDQEYLYGKNGFILDQPED